MCLFCGHQKKGGVENSAVGTWSKGISLIFCSSIFLLHIMETNGFLLVKQHSVAPENLPLYYLSIGNIIGATTLLIFSLLGHFVSKTLLRPIYLSSFIVSLFLFSSGVYTTSLCKNTSLKIIGIMDALKYHPDYMIVKTLHSQKPMDPVLKEGANGVSLNLDGNAALSAPKNGIEKTLAGSLISQHKNGSVSDVPNADTETASTVPSLAFLRDSALTDKLKADALLNAVNPDVVLQKIKEINQMDVNETSAVMKNFILHLYEKMKSTKMNLDLIDKIRNYASSNDVLLPAVQKMENLTGKIKHLLSFYGGSLFQDVKFDIIKHEDKIYKIYQNSVTKIKEVQANKDIPSLSDYISDDMKKRNLFIVTSTLIFMSFIYIHKSATLTMESSVSISLLYMPCMSYIITLACVFVCCGIFFLSILGFVMYVFGLLLLFFLFFAQCFCERLFKCIMGLIFLFLIAFSFLIQYVMIKDFNRGTELYLQYKKNNFEDYYWLLLDSNAYEKFKAFILFSNGQILLICISLCTFTMIYSLYCTFYSFCSLIPKSKKIVSFA